MPTFPRIIPLGDSGLTVEFGDRIAPEMNDLVLGFAHAIERQAVPGLVEIVPTYRSAALYFDPLTTDTRRKAQADGVSSDGRPCVYTISRNPTPFS